jgi:hypothetical protein
VRDLLPAIFFDMEEKNYWSGKTPALLQVGLYINFYILQQLQVFSFVMKLHH